MGIFLDINLHNIGDREFFFLSKNKMTIEKFKVEVNVQNIVLKLREIFVLIL